jgi:SAM-dependent methyltransferase
MNRPLAAILCLLLGCAATSAPPAAPAPPTAPVAPQSPPPPSPAPAAPEAESSVRPGANEQYLRSPDVEEWIKRFERGGREIFDHRQEILAASGVRPGMAVADVGAGTGLFTRLFARAVGPTGKVYAVDIVPKFLAHIEAEAKREGLTNVTTVLNQDRSTALPEASVDLLFLCDSYHHFEYPRSMNASMWKALRPGGTLLLIDFRRVPGKSAPFVLEHVRAGQEVFTAELQAAGFEKVAESDLLKENYVVRFRKPDRTRN